MSLQLPFGIKSLNKYSNVDDYYGYYSSVEEAKSSIPESIRDLGLTVGILENGKIVEYWWKEGTTENDLVLKNNVGSYNDLTEKPNLNISNWDTAYNDKINTITITGDANKTVTLTQQDGTTLTANFQDIDTTGTDIKINALDFTNTNGVLTATRDDEITVTTTIDGRYSLLGHTHLISDITDFPTNISHFNNDAGYITNFTNSYVDGAGFNVTNGVLLISRNNGLPDVTVDLDGRYSTTDTTYTAGTGLSLAGTTFNIDNPFNPNGTYSGLRAQATTAADVGLSNVPNWSSGTFDERYVRTDSTNQTISGNKTFTGNIISNGNDSLNSNILVRNTANQTGFIWLDSNNSLRLDAGSTSVRDIIFNGGGNGNVGIGDTSPNEKLDVNGSIRINYNSSGNNSFIQDNSAGYGKITPFDNNGVFTFDTNYTTSSGGYNFKYNNSTKLRILTNGDVGIGTDTPFEKLEVNGNIKATKFYQSSLRSLKTNINTYKEDALSLVNDLDIVGFDYKKGGEDNIGIIADDSPSEFLSEKKDAVNLYNTVFIQAKAIQELSKKNEELERRLEKLENLIKNG